MSKGLTEVVYYMKVDLSRTLCYTVSMDKPVFIDNQDNIYVDPPKVDGCSECGAAKDPKSVSGLCNDCEEG